MDARSRALPGSGSGPGSGSRPSRRAFARIRYAVLALALALATALPALGPMQAYAQDNGSGSKTAARSSRSLVVAVSQSVDTFNPFMGFFSIGQTITGLGYDSLIRWSPKNFAPEPGLATKWKVSKDGLTWTYTIRSGVKFSDGKPFTAHDVWFTYHTMMTNPDAHKSYLDLVDNFRTIDAPNDTTFVVTLKKPTSQMLSLDNPIVPEHIWKSRLKSLGAYKNMDFPLIGAGPFQVTQFKTDEFIRLKANKDYWGGAPKYDELVFRYYKNGDAAVQALLSGDVDVVSGLTPEQYKSLKGHKGITLNRGPGRRVHSITFNMGARTKDGKRFGDGHPALLDPRVRKAIQYATNKKELIDKVDDGMATEGVAYIPPLFSVYFWNPPAADKVNFDLAKANQILDDAGYKRGSNGIRIDPKSKRPLEFRLLNHSDTPTEATDSQFMKEWWQKIGIKADIQSEDSGKLNDDLYVGKYDIIFSGWGVTPDPTSILALYTCDSLPTVTDGSQRNTDTFYCNPAYDKLHEQQKRESDIGKRATIVKQMQQILYDDAPEITLRNRDVLEAYRSDRWKGFVVQPAGHGMITGQMGNWSYMSATPVGQDDGGSRTGVILGGVGAVVVLALVAGFFALRRRRTAEERE